MNCWEFNRCGQKPGDGNSGGTGICPTVSNNNFNGFNGGINAGRSCWMVGGTYCCGEKQGTFVDKTAACQKCNFYKHVESAGDGFLFFKQQAQAPAGNSRVTHEERILSSKSDDELSILYLLQQLSATENSKIVNLMNIYKEIPISNSSELIEITGSSVQIATTESQIAVIKACGETFISTEHFHLAFLGRLEEYDVKRSIVTLNNLSYADIYTNFRNTVRVRLKKPLNLVMRVMNNIISGSIQDLSLGGCCINTLTTAGLNSENEVTLELKLLDSTTNQLLVVDVPCEAVRIDCERRPFKVALRFVHNKQSEDVVSRFIFQRQLEIVKELRELL
jgi:hypothetical protein